jgi:hypothetical protein
MILSSQIFVNIFRKQPAKGKKVAMCGYANQVKTPTEAMGLKWSALYHKLEHWSVKNAVLPAP